MSYQWNSAVWKTCDYIKDDLFTGAEGGRSLLDVKQLEFSILNGDEIIQILGDDAVTAYLKKRNKRSDEFGAEIATITGKDFIVLKDTSNGIRIIHDTEKFYTEDIQDLCNALNAIVIPIIKQSVELGYALGSVNETTVVQECNVKIEETEEYKALKVDADALTNKLEVMTHQKELHRIKALENQQALSDKNLELVRALTEINRLKLTIEDMSDCGLMTVIHDSSKEPLPSNDPQIEDKSPVMQESCSVKADPIADYLNRIK